MKAGQCGTAAVPTRVCTGDDLFAEFEKRVATIRRQVATLAALVDSEGRGDSANGRRGATDKAGTGES